MLREPASTDQYAEYTIEANARGNRPACLRPFLNISKLVHPSARCIRERRAEGLERIGEEDRDALAEQGRISDQRHQSGQVAEHSKVLDPTAEFDGIDRN